MPIIAILIIALITAFSGYFVVSFPPKAALITMVTLGIFVFAFLSTKLSLVLLLFSMLFSPEISLGRLSADRSIVFRYDDILLVTIFFSWFFKNAVLKSKPLITKTPLLIPLLLYTSLFIISTFIGILKGNISFSKSFFYVLKYVEYFLLYFMCVNVIELEDIKKYSRYWLWIFIGVTLYAYYYYFNAVGGDVRTTAPFEAPLNSPRGAEPASLGGFYLIAFSFLLALMSQYRGKIFVYSVSLFASAFLAFVYTFSRASYMGMFVIFVVFLFLGRGRRIFAVLMALGLALFIMVTPNAYRKMEQRIKSTYSGEYARHSINFLETSVKLEESAYLRYASLKTVLTKHLPESPLVGKGVTGVGLGDNQYSLLLGEIGALGFFAFWFWIFKIYGMASEVYKKSDDPLFRSVALGVTMALSGLLVQGIGVNTFIIVRIMEPFWFIVAVLTVIYGRLPGDGAREQGGREHL